MRKRTGAVIVFKACPKCGGDVDTTYNEDIYCIQCAYRPDVVSPAPRVVERRPEETPRAVRSHSPSTASDHESVARIGQPDIGAACPKCASDRLVRLDKHRPRDNTCYRCRPCGHIFSPAGDAARQRQDAMLP